MTQPGFPFPIPWFLKNTINNNTVIIITDKTIVLKSNSNKKWKRI